jgi:hypothetical protein
LYFLAIAVPVFEGNSNLLAVKLITIVVAAMIAIKKIKLKIMIVIAMVASNRPVRPFKDSKSVAYKKEPKYEF